MLQSAPHPIIERLVRRTMFCEWWWWTSDQLDLLSKIIIIILISALTIQENWFDIIIRNGNLCKYNTVVKPLLDNTRVFLISFDHIRHFRHILLKETTTHDEVIKKRIITYKNKIGCDIWLLFKVKQKGAYRFLSSPLAAFPPANVLTTQWQC